MDKRIADATALLDEGELVVLPTDTRYVLASDALHEDALARLFEATHRAADRPLTVILSGIEDVGHVAQPTPLARQLAEDKWPGPIALLMRAKPWIPDALTAARDTVAVRVPAQDLTRDLARHFGPIAVASLDGAAHPAARLVLDVGKLPGGRHAVVDVTGSEPVVLR